MLVFADNGGYRPEMSDAVKPYFEGMKTADKNYLNARIINGKLVVCLCAENQQILPAIMERLSADVFYKQ